MSIERNFIYEIYRDWSKITMRQCVMCRRFAEKLETQFSRFTFAFLANHQALKHHTGSDAA